MTLNRIIIVSLLILLLIFLLWLFFTLGYGSSGGVGTGPTFKPTSQ